MSDFPKRPRPEFAQIRKYIESLSSDQRLTKSQFAKALEISLDYLESIEQGRNLKADDLAQQPVIKRLVKLLIQKELLDEALKEEFILDLNARRSVVDYFPALIQSRVPKMQDALLLKNPDDLMQLGQYRQNVFRGYEHEFDHATEQLTNRKRVLIYGLGGAGKTTLAIKISKDYLARGDLILWLEVGDAQPADIQREILKVLPQKKTFLESLQAAHIHLIVLDNIWTSKILGIVDWIPPHIHVLLTSRGNMTISNKEKIPLDGVDESTALVLLSEYAQQTDMDNQEAVRLCKKLAYQPYALMIAGTAIERSGGTLSVGDIGENLSQYVLKGETGRNETIAALIEQNFRSPHIRPEHRAGVSRAFYAFGALFSSDVPLPLLELLEWPEDNFESLLNYYLIPFNMIKYKIAALETKHYQLHELAYAVAESHCTAAHRLRGIQACIRYVRQSFEGLQPKRFERLYLVRRNLAGAAETMVEYLGEPEMQSLFLELIWLLASNGYFDANGYSSAWVDYMQQAALIAEERGLVREEHYLQAKIGNGYANALSQYDLGFAAYFKAAELAVHLENPSEAVQREAISYSLMGTVAFRQNNPKQAEDLFAFAEQKASSDPVALSQVYEHQGHFAASNKNFQLAENLFQRSLDTAEQHINEGQTTKLNERCFYAHINLAEVYLINGDCALAVRETYLAYQFAVVLDLDDLKARALAEIGRKNLACDHIDKAKEAFCEALKLYEKLEDVTQILRLKTIIQEQQVTC